MYVFVLELLLYEKICADDVQNEYRVERHFVCISWGKQNIMSHKDGQ